MGRCENCIHWEKSTNEEYNLIRIGKCLKAKEFWDCTKWDKNRSRIFKPGCEDAKMFVTDGYDYTPYLFTIPSFFCAEFKEK